MHRDGWFARTTCPYQLGLARGLITFLGEASLGKSSKWADYRKAEKEAEDNTQERQGRKQRRRQRRSRGESRA